MNNQIISLDTNILFYSLDSKATERHEIAIKIIKHAIKKHCILSLQTLAEFYFSTTRKGLLSSHIARQQIEDWQILFTITTAKPNTLNQAIAAVENYQLSFWDAMLWATVKEAKVSLLITDDYQHNRVIDGVRFFNPFIDSNWSEIFT